MKFSVRELADMTGVTVRTLHLYDQIGLLIPSIRTEARYRWYGEEELFRLQQILFYRELGFPLKEVSAILDEPGFDLIVALEGHKAALKNKQERIAEMLKTIDATVLTLKGKKKMSNHEELYKGLTPAQAKAFKEEATGKYGPEAVETAEKHLTRLSKEDIRQLRQEQQEIIRGLHELIAEKPQSNQVQQLISRHYQNTRQFWGTVNSADSQREAYKGLGELYVSDERFIQSGGKSDPLLARFMRDAMMYYAEQNLSFNAIPE